MPQREQAVVRRRDTTVELRVLLKNKRACCVCHSSDRPIHLHHIDGNRDRTTEDNLAVLCLTHHDQATAGLQKGQTGLGRKLSREEVAEHKRLWERVVAAEMRIRRTSSKRRSSARRLEEQFEYEVLRTTNEILTSPRGTPTRRLFSFLQQFVMDEHLLGIRTRRILLKRFDHLCMWAAVDGELASGIISTVKEVNSHLVGPQNVPLDAEDRWVLLESFELLETLGSYSVMSDPAPRGILERVCNAFEELAEIASWYRFEKATDRAIKLLRKLRNTCVEEQRMSGGRLQRRLELVDRCLRTIRLRARAKR